MDRSETGDGEVKRTLSEQSNIEQKHLQMSAKLMKKKHTQGLFTAAFLGVFTFTIISANAVEPVTEPIGGQPAPGAKPSVADLEYQVAYQRAFEAVVWSMPAVGIYRFREGSLKAFGIGDNDIIAFSKPATPRAELLTANNVTPYIFGFTDLRNGPVVLVIS